MKLNHAVASFVLMGIMIALCAGIYNNISEFYSLTDTDTDASGNNIMNALNNLNLLGGINQSVNAIYSIANPTNPIDVLGSLLSAGIGAVRTITGIVSFPIEILLIVTDFYTGWIPSIVSQGIGLLFGLYIGFILLDKYLRGA